MHNSFLLASKSSKPIITNPFYCQTPILGLGLGVNFVFPLSQEEQQEEQEEEQEQPLKSYFLFQRVLGSVRG